MEIKWHNVAVIALVIFTLSVVLLAPEQLRTFFSNADPFILEWLPTWTVAAIAGLIVGALIRILRNI